MGRGSDDPPPLTVTDGTAQLILITTAETDWAAWTDGVGTLQDADTLPPAMEMEALTVTDPTVQPGAMTLTVIATGLLIVTDGTVQVEIPLSALTL